MEQSGVSFESSMLKRDAVEINIGKLKTFFMLSRELGKEQSTTTWNRTSSNKHIVPILHSIKDVQN
jgi:hypothetical protein